MVFNGNYEFCVLLVDDVVRVCVLTYMCCLQFEKQMLTILMYAYLFFLIISVVAVDVEHISVS